MVLALGRAITAHFEITTFATHIPVVNSPNHNVWAVACGFQAYCWLVTDKEQVLTAVSDFFATRAAAKKQVAVTMGAVGA